MVSVARLKPSGVKPYLFHTLKKAACVRTAGSMSPAKTFKYSLISPSQTPTKKIRKRYSVIQLFCN